MPALPTPTTDFCAAGTCRLAARAAPCQLRAGEATLSVAEGFEPRFSSAAVASQVSGFSGTRVSRAHPRCIWLFCNLFLANRERACSYLVIRRGTSFPLVHLGSLLDKAVSEGCK